MINLNPKVDLYLIDGCGRCKFYATPHCKVHTWKDELQMIRQIALESGLVEELKWNVPVYTFEGKNIFIVSAFKEFCSIAFFKGVLLKDDAKILEKQGENQQSSRLIKFTDTKKITKLKKTILAYIKEAVTLEEKGVKVEFKKNPEPTPQELLDRMDEWQELKKAFYQLAPGKQRGYILHFSQPKQSATRLSRINTCAEKILRGEGFHDAYKKGLKN